VVLVGTWHLSRPNQNTGIDNFYYPSFIPETKLKKKSKLDMRHQSSYGCRSPAQLLLCSEGQCTSC